MVQAGYSQIYIVLRGDKDELRTNDRRIKEIPKNKPVMIMGWYSIAETDDPEDINSIGYLKEVDIDTLEVTGEIKDFVAIISDKYHEKQVNFHN